MELLLSEVNSIDVRVGSLDDVNQSLVLWVIHADKIPPHIGLSVDGLFYSLKAGGKDMGLPVDQLLSLIERKQITTVCYLLGKDLTPYVIESVFNDFDKTVPYHITCLDPVKKVLSIDKAGKLSELLEVLSNRDQIKKIVGFNSQDFSGIKDYNVEQIHARLEELSDG